MDNSSCLYLASLYPFLEYHVHVGIRFLILDISCQYNSEVKRVSENENTID